MSTIQKVNGLAVLALLLVAGMATPAHAQPEGTYKQSCSGFYMDGTTLRADCKDRGGRTIGTFLDLSSNWCATNITNVNGNLFCESVPGGSYRESCRNVQVRVTNGVSTMLYECKDRNGNYQKSSTAVTCNTYKNLNGAATCG
jgi:hypothetical protein